MKGEQKNPDYVKLNPLGVIPVVDDDGFLVIESRAICRYLSNKYQNQGTQLVPTDVKENGLFEQGAYFETCEFNDPVQTLVTERLFKKFRGLEPDEARCKDAEEKLNKVLDVYEVVLAKQEYIGGNKFSLADIYHLPYGSLAFDKCGAQSILDSHPLSKNWWEKIYRRESWQSRESF
jgi:glutathione S-transferase